MEPGDEEDQGHDFFRTVHHKWGWTGPYQDNQAYRLGMLAGMITIRLPKWLKPLAKWPLVLLLVLGYFLLTPIRMLRRPRRRFGNPSE